MKTYSKGFSMIEAMVVFAISALLVVLAMPHYKTWGINTQIRNAAESLQNGLRLAQMEAARRNQLVNFTLLAPGTVTLPTTAAPEGSCPAPEDYDSLSDITATPSGSRGFDWIACAISEDKNLRYVQAEKMLGDQSTVAMKMSFSNTDDESGNISFVGSGSTRLNGIVTIDVKNYLSESDSQYACAEKSGAGGEIRCLRVTLSNGGKIRMCDPAQDAGQPTACD